MAYKDHQGARSRGSGAETSCANGIRAHQRLHWNEDHTGRHELYLIHVEVWPFARSRGQGNHLGKNQTTDRLEIGRPSSPVSNHRYPDTSVQHCQDQSWQVTRGSMYCILRNLHTVLVLPMYCLRRFHQPKDLNLPRSLLYNVVITNFPPIISPCLLRRYHHNHNATDLLGAIGP